MPQHPYTPLNTPMHMRHRPSSAASGTQNSINSNIVCMDPSIQQPFLHAPQTFNADPVDSGVSVVPGGRGHSIVVSKYTVAEGVARKRATPTSRVWILVYALLTWLMSIAFCSVSIYVFRSSSTHLGIVQKIGCIERSTQLTNWTGIIKAYNISKIATPSAVNYGKFMITSLQDSLAVMNCSSAGLLDYYQVLGAETDTPSVALQSGKDALMAQMFTYNSPQCSCLAVHHTTVLIPNLNKTIATYGAGAADAFKAQAEAVVKKFLFDGQQFDNATSTALSNTNYPSVLRSCFLNRRPAQFAALQDDCATTVIPYNIVTYINVVAALFSAIYIIQTYPMDESHAHDKTPAGMFAYYVSSKYATAFFLALNFALGMAALVITATDSDASSTSISYIFGIIGLIMTTLVVGMLRANMSQEIVDWWNRFTGRSTQDTETRKIKADKQLHELRTDAMRLAFWVQYLMLLPAFVMLLDHVQQNRMYTWTYPRIMTCIGLAFLALATDLCYLVQEYMQDVLFEKDHSLFLSMRGRDSRDSRDSRDMADAALYDKVYSRFAVLGARGDDNARSAVWWAWGSWCIIACSLFVLDSPIHMNVAVLGDLVPSSVLPLAVAVFVIGMPMFAKVPIIHEENTKAYSWQGDRSTMALALCLSVEFVARLLLTMSVVYWTVF